MNFCVCRLPVPWLMYSFIHGLAPVAVSSNGLFCAIVLLFLMLLFVIISIAACKWRMNKMLGFTMFMLYFVFLVLSVMLEDRIIVCPVSIWATHWLYWNSTHSSYNQSFVLFCFTPPNLQRRWEPLGYLLVLVSIHAKTFQQYHEVNYDAIFAICSAVIYFPHFLHTSYIYQTTCIPYGAIDLAACDYGWNYRFPVL